MEITIWKITVQLCLAGLATFMYKLYKVRTMVRRVKSVHGVDILPHSFLFGHLLEIDRVMRKYKFPPKAHGHWLALFFIQEYPELADRGILYLDLWPVLQPLLTVWHPDLLGQIQEANFPKAELMREELGPVTGAKDILTLEGREWKRTRAMFNPGFSAQNLLSLVPEFIAEIEIFKAKLRQAAESGEIVKLEKWTTLLAADVIGRAVLGASLDGQTTSSPLLNTLSAQLPLLYNALDFKKALNPVRYLNLWLYRRRFRKLLLPYIDRAVQEYDDTSTKSKTVLNLALKEELRDKSQPGVSSDFVEHAVGHFWIFLFAGHDTTATTLAFIYYLLSRNPDKAAILRAEHDKVFGSDPAIAAERLKSNPALVNQLPYTTAVFKETLRLWPPLTGGIRSSPPGHFVTHPDTGERFPTHSWMINNAGAILQRSDKYWPQPNDFLPERWLVSDPEDPLCPKKGTFRPFEMGLRNCIGQELASIEVRLVLAMTVRQFDVVDQYPEHGPTLLGEKAYSVEMPENVVTAHALDQMPVVIKSRC